MENFEIEKTEELFQAIKTKALKIIEVAQKEHDLDELSILDNQLYMILKQSFDSNSAQNCPFDCLDGCILGNCEL